MNHHSPVTLSSLSRSGLAMLLFALASCESPAPTASRQVRPANYNLDGRNTLSEVTIRSGGDSVAISGTTVDGRRIKAKGRTTRQAVDNLGIAAGNSQ